MNIIDVDAQTTIRIRVPETWGAARIARELNGGTLIDRNDKPAFRPSQIVWAKAKDVTVESISVVGSDRVK